VNGRTTITAETRDDQRKKSEREENVYERGTDTWLPAMVSSLGTASTCVQSSLPAEPFDIDIDIDKVVGAMGCESTFKRGFNETQIGSHPRP